MPKRTLHDCRILVVEDEYFLADELHSALLDAGALVIGPVGTVDQAVSLISSDQRIDGAILDINLGGDWVFPAADELIKRSVPFLFTTGYGASTIPPRFEHVTLCEKPVNIRQVTAALGRVVHPT